jgi:uncharacterized metal-binding protein
VNCATCENKICHQGTDCGEGIDSSDLYDREEDRRLFAVAAEVESEGYCRLGRIEELMLFAGKLGLRRLGLAFCVGLSEEARLLDEVLGRHFEVTSVCCKVCALCKDELGLRKIREDRSESACNPIGQAAVLRKAGTELNIIVGLCIGHDILFARYSAAPVTTLVVKDRVLGHNPVAALHSSYHRRRLLAGGPAEKAR